MLLLGACPRSITDDPGYTLHIAPTTASLFVEDSARFSATVTDRDGRIISTELSWSVDNEAVVTVDSNGKVRALSPGSAVLRVSGRGLTASASIAVAEDNGTLTLSPATASVFVNATQDFTATLRDRDGDVVPSTPEWSSSNTAVATIDANGTARGRASGSATIRAKVGDLTAEATLTVTERPPSATLVGAGDIAGCTSSYRDEATADLLDGIEGTVFTAGDNAYPDGTATEYAECYGPSWGRHKARTRPVPGNHEYHTIGGSGYFGYFGAAAGDPAKGYYSYELGRWHIIALNSNAAISAGSPQEQWLRQDLADHPATCTLAIFHHPRFSSSRHGSNPTLAPLWQALFDGGADVVISAHDHTYERFAPQTPAGVLDMARGLRAFVVGTGGASQYEFNAPQPNSEVRNNTSRGVLKLTLYPDRYEWQFIPIKGATFTDAGSASCH